MDNKNNVKINGRAWELAWELRQYASDRRRSDFVRSLFKEAADVIGKLLENQERSFKALDTTKNLKRLTFRDEDGNAHMNTSAECSLIDPVGRLALLEDIVEEARG